MTLKLASSLAILIGSAIYVGLIIGIAAVLLRLGIGAPAS